MRKILILCIKLLLLIITDAVPLQLIPGDRSVVKKDGATHTISKYYVVPNDFDPNNVTNSTKASQTKLRVNNHYSKSMDANEDQANEKKAEAANETNENNADVNNTEVNSSSGLNDAEVEVATQANDIDKSTGSVSTGQSLDLDDLGNLQVEPITNSININGSDTINKINDNSSKALRTSLIVETATQPFERDVENELDDLILTKFGTTVQESSVQNLESFWKLIKLTIDRISDNDELLAKIERLSLLLNIFTNLYEAAQLQKPIESMIDNIIDILQIPFVTKSNTSESKSQTDVSGDYDKECLRKCGLKRSKPQLDSSGTYLSETEGLEGSDNLELEKLNLKRRDGRDSDDDWVNTSNVPVSNQVTVSNQPTNILRSQLLVPNNLNVGVPDGYNVLSSIPTPTYVTRNNDIQEDPKSNQIIPDSPESGKNTDDQLLTFERILTDDWPRTIKDKSTQNVPWTVQTITTDDLPWHIEDKTTDDLPWHIEDKTTDDLPWHIEDKTTDDLPWHIEDRTTDNLPWHIEDKTTDDLPWHIEDKSIDHHPITINHRTTHILPWSIEDTGTKNVHWKVEKRAPITLYKSRNPSFITHGGKILLHANQPMTATVRRIKQGVKKPYHIYTYVINPTTFIDEIPYSDNIVKVKSRQPNDNLGTKVYGIYSSHGGNKIVYTNKPSPSYDGSQFSLSKPTIDISSQISNSQLKHMNYVTYDKINQVNPTTLISETPQDDYQPKYLVGHVPETNDKPVLLQLKTLPLDSQTDSDQENEEPQVPEVGSHPGVLLPNVPSNPFESLITNGPVSTASASASAVTSYDNPDIGDTKPIQFSNLIYNPNINLNLMQQKNSHPDLNPKTSFHSEYTNLSDNDDEPSPVYSGYGDKHPGLISTSSFSSAYTNSPDDYAEPVYGGQTQQHPDLISSSAYSNSGYTNLPDEHVGPVDDVQTYQHPGLITSSATSNSEYTNVADDFDEPNPVYGGQTQQHPDLISSSAYSSSGYTNLPDEHDGPVDDVQTYQHPGLITSSATSNSEYTNVADDFDEPNPVYGGQTQQHPNLIPSSAYSSSGYTNLPDEHDEPVYDVQTHRDPVLITSSATSNSKYTNVADDFDEPNPVYGGQTHNYPGFISKVLPHSKYTNLPNDYNNPTSDYGQHTDIHPGLITKVNHYNEHNNVVDDYDEPMPVYGEEEINKHSGLISSSASSHSEYTNLPNEYNNPTNDYEEDTDRYPVHVQTLANGRPTENEDNLLVSYHPYGHTTGLNYQHLKLAPTYGLFTLDNLLKLRHVVIKTMEVNGDETDFYDYRALINLRKIINIILKLAEHLEEPEGSIEWYEKIFYNTQKNQHPLEIYVYHLIRQRWLHELMLILHHNDFNLNILLNPKIFSFLGSWQFPHYVLNYIEGEELIQHDFDAPEVLDQTLSTQHGLQDKFATHTYTDLLNEVPEDLENYVTNKVVNSYETPNAGIVLSIAGVEAEPDANAIINILQKYLHYKSFIEKQQTGIIRDNKVEMLNQIILFLREKGYGATTIIDLIRKLYTAVYSNEGKGCQTHHTNFAKNMYDVILPVLRRSGR